MFRRFVLPLILFCVYSILSRTWRVRILEPEPLKKALEQKAPMVLAHWHGDELALVMLIRRYRVATMTSTSKDGELMNSLIHLLGGRTSRGSSTRGGVSALKGLLAIVRDGFNPSIAVDGPKGPYHKAKPGVFEVSRILKAPIWPVAIVADRAFVFKKSWNQTFLPYPFARVQVVWTESLPVVSREDDPRSPDWSQRLEVSLDNAKQQAHQLLIASAKSEC